VAFELDGAAWHTSPVDRARDLRRDAALAALGILVVRYTYERLHAEPMAVRAEARSILAVHRRRRGA
jgi:very-short-patch-repair endonuclease